MDEIEKAFRAIALNKLCGGIDEVVKAVIDDSKDIEDTNEKIYPIMYSVFDFTKYFIGKLITFSDEGLRGILYISGCFAFDTIKKELPVFSGMEIYESTVQGMVEIIVRHHKDKDNIDIGMPPYWSEQEVTSRTREADNIFCLFGKQFVLHIITKVLHKEFKSRGVDNIQDVIASYGPDTEDFSRKVSNKIDSTVLNIVLAHPETFKNEEVIKGVYRSLISELFNATDENFLSKITDSFYSAFVDFMKNRTIN